MADPHKATREIKLKSNQLVDKVREIIDEGNARRIIIKKEGRSVLELPLSVGVGGAAAALLVSPMLTAVGAFAALAGDVSIEVEPMPKKPGATPPEQLPGAATSKIVTPPSEPGAPSAGSSG